MSTEVSLPSSSPSTGRRPSTGSKKGWFLVPSEKAPKPGDGALKADGLEVWVDPRAEWRQMYRETWRIQRDFLYDPGAHGLDLAAAEKLYAPFVDGLGGRDDLNVLFEEMLGHLVLGHVFVGGGDVPEQEKVSVGLLGADYAVERKGATASPASSPARTGTRS